MTRYMFVLAALAALIPCAHPRSIASQAPLVEASSRFDSLFYKAFYLEHGAGRPEEAAKLHGEYLELTQGQGAYAREAATLLAAYRERSGDVQGARALRAAHGVEARSTPPARREGGAADHEQGPAAQPSTPESGQPRAQPGAGPRGPAPGMRPQAGQSIQSRPTLAAGATEERILAVLDDMHRTQRRGMMNVPVEDGRLLRLLVESIGARHVVEIGTSNGYSAIWQCLALKATGGRLTTFEIDARRAALARENFKRAGVEELVTLIEGNAHEKVGALEGPIDLLFIDADKDGYIHYLNMLLPKIRPGGLIIGHNINPRQADPRYIEAITTNPALETLILNDTGGISVTLKKRTPE